MKSSDAGLTMRYQGGKNGAGVYQTIINRIPVHHRYIEPFAGSAAVYRRKSPAASSVLVERDPGQAQKLAMLASSNTEVFFGCAFDWLASHLSTMGAADFVYLDPPYLHETRKDVNLYRHELTDKHHEHLVLSLLPAMSDRGVRWMLSGYASKLYDDAAMLQGWHRHEFTAMTRRGPATEVIWMNYDPSAAVIAESTYAGSDFRERGRIKRKAERWANKFNAMPIFEQRAILAMLERHQC
jgi:site-specific DNA-adenine methylase